MINNQGENSQNKFAYSFNDAPGFQMRGLNNNKASPDSGWTFPAMPNYMNPSNQQYPATNFMMNGNGPKIFPHPLNPDMRNQQLARDNVYRGVFMNSFQSNVMTPHLEMNFQQQQQQFLEKSNVTNNLSLNFFPFKHYEGGFPGLNSQSNPTFDIFSSLNRLPTPHQLTPTSENVHNNLFIAQSSKASLSDTQQNRIPMIDFVGNQALKLTPIETPTSDMKTIHDSLIQPLLFKPSLTIPDLRFYNNTVQNIPTNNLVPSHGSYMVKTPVNENGNIKNDKFISSHVTANSESNSTNVVTTANAINGNHGDKAINVTKTVASVVSPNILSREESHEISKSTEEQKRQIFGENQYTIHDPRLHQSHIASGIQLNSYAGQVPSAEMSQNKSSSTQPRRPNHLGSTFIPQTHFLSINTNHGSTPSSDKESTLSSNSSDRHSPYSISSTHQSRTPSPHNIDKHAKERLETSCNQCGKGFGNPSALAKHKLTHSEERKYVCHICTRSFKRQDHLNGHMLTHRDKKPFECHVADCGKSYCDNRSLRRHLENHHTSPTGGSTPGSYMPTLYPATYSDNALGANLYKSNNHLLIASEPQRPSSAPLVPPEAKRITRNRRSSSGEESGLKIDPMMLQEIESRKHKNLKADNNRISPKLNSESNKSHPSQQRYEMDNVNMGKNASMPIASEYSHLKSDYDHTRMRERTLYDPYNMYSNYSKFYADLHSQNEEQRHVESKSHLQDDISVEARRNPDVRKDFYPPVFSSNPPPSSSGLPPPVNQYSWASQPSSKSAFPSTNSMPYLFNVRNPFGMLPHSLFPPPIPSASPSTEVASETSSGKDAEKMDHIRQQAMNTYFQVWINSQRGSLPPEQIAMLQNQLMRYQNLPTPTDPTAIAVATAKEHSERPYSLYRENYYGIHPSVAQWQTTIMKDKSPRAMEKETRPSYYPVHSYMHSQRSGGPSDVVFPRQPRETKSQFAGDDRNIIDEPFKPSESTRYTVSPRRAFYDRSHPPTLQPHIMDRPSPSNERPRSLEPPRNLEINPRHNLTEPSRHFEGSHMESDRIMHEKKLSEFAMSKSALVTGRYEPNENSPKQDVRRVHIDENHGMATPSAVSPANRKRPHPGPIIIPPSVNNISTPVSSADKGFHALAKSIYTPPAMLSPKSVFFNRPVPAPRLSVTPATPARMLLSIRRSTSIDQRENSTSTSVSSDDQLHISTEMPEPKINVGAEFQAVLPNKVDRSESQKDIHRASLMWAPVKEDETKIEEINAYLDMACSLALYGGSNNKEYALHILQRTRGNIKEAVRLLLSRRHILRADDPNADYHYSGSVRWTAKERLAFRQAYRTKGKVFSAIQHEVSTKSVQLCVEFYYLWKAMHPESFRARTRVVEVESEQDDEEVPPTPTAAVAPLSTLREPVFECDYPECRARFISRQALNGHIRVHGGSLTKPPDSRRAKHKVGFSDVGEGDREHSLVGTPPKKKKPPAATSVIVANTTDGPPLQFQCKVCGRVFSKVKSRSAHMKTHVKRDENNKPIKSAKSAKQLQHKQQLQQKHMQAAAAQSSYPPLPSHIPPPAHINQPHPSAPPHIGQHEQLPPSSINPMTLYAHA